MRSSSASLAHPLFFPTVFLCLTVAWPVAAQDAADAPAHLNAVEGAAMLAHDNDFESAAPGVPLIPGDRLETSGGRLEILWPDGTALDLDEYSRVELGGPALLRLTRGRLALTTPRSGDRGSLTYAIDTPAGSARVNASGEYRVALVPSPSASGFDVQLSVVRGSASLSTDRGTMSLAAGQTGVARDDEPPGAPTTFNTASLDPFASWAAARRDERAATASARYLPPDLRVYSSALDENGAWEYDSPYGYVWYPAVSADWRPYYDGYWTSVPSYGFTWVGLDAWSWPTHHYGRWGFSRSGWFWVPDRRWAPAWVSWASAPTYVSWCPLGADNQPVSGLSLVTASVPSGWVVLPRTLFGAPVHVPHYAVRPSQLGASPTFVAQAAAPPTRRDASGRRSVALVQSQTRSAPPSVGTATPRETGAAGATPMTTVLPAPAPGIAGTASPRYPDTPAVPVVVGGAVRQRPPTEQEWRGRRRAPEAVPPAAVAAPPPPPAPSAPGTVPRWSAPSVPVPQSMAPVPSWSAPSGGVPRWSAPAISTTPAVPAETPPATAPAPRHEPPPTAAPTRGSHADAAGAASAGSTAPRQGGESGGHRGR